LLLLLLLPLLPLLLLLLLLAVGHNKAWPPTAVSLLQGRPTTVLIPTVSSWVVVSRHRLLAEQLLY
jgi:hypothetical protein